MNKLCRIVERHQAVIVEEREGDKLKQLYVACTKDFLNLLK